MKFWQTYYKEKKEKWRNKMKLPMVDTPFILRHLTVFKDSSLISDSQWTSNLINVLYEFSPLLFSLRKWNSLKILITGTWSWNNHKFNFYCPPLLPHSLSPDPHPYQGSHSCVTQQRFLRFNNALANIWYLLKIVFL